jgi:hypothetical protein
MNNRRPGNAIYIALRTAEQEKCSQPFTARAFRSGAGLAYCLREYDLRLRLGVVDQLAAEGPFRNRSRVGGVDLSSLCRQLESNKGVPNIRNGKTELRY